MKISGAIVFACVVGALPSGSGAQTVSGRVVNRMTGRPLAGVTVRSGARTTATDSVGRFITSRSVLGPARIRLRLIGYAPKDTVLDLMTRDTTYVVLGMVALATRLDTVNVAAPAEMAGQITEFEERRVRGEGRYISTAELRKLEDRAFPDVLRARMPGLGILPTPMGTFLFSRAQTGFDGAPCFVQIVWDGIPIYRKGGTRDLPPDMSLQFIRDFDGVEYYSSPTRTPVKYRSQGAACGTLILWSRRK